MSKALVTTRDRKALKQQHVCILGSGYDNEVLCIAKGSTHQPKALKPKPHRVVWCAIPAFELQQVAK